MITTLAFSASAADSQKQIIAAAELSGLFEKDLHGRPYGAYATLIQQALNETGLEKEYELVILPMKRAKVGFINKQFACYAPGIDTFDQPDERQKLTNTLTSAPLNIALVRVLSDRDLPLVTSLADISAEDTISIVRGTPMSTEMRQLADRAYRMYQVQSELENIAMLQNHRVNHLFVFYPDVLFAYERLGLAQHFAYAKGFSPLIIHDAITCHAKHTKALNTLSATIREYREDGTLQKVLGQAYLLDSPCPPISTSTTNPPHRASK
ncbi:hypothetical protein ACFQMB_15030 [Pseudobowmanella zhangzhouensis]|uniref:hypothetical protein n=1 Tax=Pseudobowmanella zhangzhouensis TaxID=1537679 RepID=UPI003623FB28